MVVNKFGDRLYKGVVDTETAHLQRVAVRIEECQGETFLRELKTQWELHNKSVQMIRDILMVGARRAAAENGMAEFRMYSARGLCWQRVPLRVWGGAALAAHQPTLLFAAHAKIRSTSPILLLVEGVWKVPKYWADNCPPFTTWYGFRFTVLFRLPRCSTWTGSM